MRTRRSLANQDRLYKAIGAQLARDAAKARRGDAPDPVDDVCPDGPACEHPECQAERVKRGIIAEPGSSLYEDVIALGIKHANHESDLYLPDTEQVRALLLHHGKAVNGWTVQRFTNQVEGGPWLDVPFAYKPYWDTRRNR
jgi:hypothetical protein